MPSGIITEAESRLDKIFSPSSGVILINSAYEGVRLGTEKDGNYP